VTASVPTDRTTDRQAAGAADEAEPAPAGETSEPDAAPRPEPESVEEAAAPAAALEPGEAPRSAIEVETTQDEDEHSRVHRTRRRPGSENEAPAEPVVVSSVADESKPKKGGWWQRKGFF
jgi:ribonuclease E